MNLGLLLFLLGGMAETVTTACDISMFFICLSGDTLFIGGCGRFLEGTAEQMYHNLTHVLGSLPQETVSRNKRYLSGLCAAVTGLAHKEGIECFLAHYP